MSPARGGRRRLTATSSKVMVVVGLAAMALAGCTSTSSGKQQNGTEVPAKSGKNGTSASSSSAGPKVKVDITPGDHANPTTPIVVKATDGTLQSVAVTNPSEHGVSVTGAFAAGKASWSSNEVLGYGKTYNVAVSAKDTDGKVLTTSRTITTMNPQTAYPSVVPPPQATDIGVGMPLAVRFDKPIQDRAATQKLLSVTSSPAQQGAWYWLSDTEVDYRPANFWAARSKLTLNIKIYGKDLGGGIYGDTDRQINYTVHDSWVAYADGNSEQMTIKQNGRTVKTMPISMGKQATPTHLGTHVISARNRTVIMDSCSYGICKGKPGYYRSKEQFAERISDDGEFVHENPKSVTAQGETNVSHGCINLNAANAAWFFQHFGVGDVVEVTNSGGPPLPLSDRIGVWAVQWPTWQAGNATS